jgi:hypothetical protein
VERFSAALGASLATAIAVLPWAAAEQLRDVEVAVRELNEQLAPDTPSVSVPIAGVEGGVSWAARGAGMARGWYSIDDPCCLVCQHLTPSRASPNPPTRPPTSSTAKTAT